MTSARNAPSAAQLVGERRATRGRSAAARRGRADASTAASASSSAARRSSKPAAPSRASKVGVHGGRRGLRRARAGGRGRPSSPAAGRAARARSVAGAELRPVGEEERDVGAELRARARAARRPAAARGASRSRAAAPSAASELPPPSPAATGIRFSIRTRQRGSTPARAASASSAPRTSVSPAKPVDAQLGGRLELDPVGERRCAGRRSTTSCLPSSRGGPTTSARLILAGAGRPHRSASASATNSGGVERLGANVGARPIAASAAAACSRVATPASSSEFGERLAPVRERGRRRPA